MSAPQVRENPQPSPLGVHVALVWRNTMLKDVWIRPGDAATLGADLNCTFTLPESAGVIGTHTLITHDEMGPLLIPPSGSSGRRASAAQLAADAAPLGSATITLEEGDRGTLDLGPFTLVFRCEPLPDRRLIPRVAPWLAWDTGLIGGILTALVGQMAFLIAAFYIWEPTPALATADFADRDFVVQMQLLPPEPEIVEPESIEDDEGASKAIEGEEGQAGEPEKPTERPTTIKRKKDTETSGMPRKGVFQAMDGLSSRGPMGGVFDGADRLKNDLDAAMAGVNDSTFVGRGNEGLGIRGTGPGGGGLHKMGTIQGVGTRSGPGRGVRGKGLKGRRKMPKTVKPDRKHVKVGDYCRQNDIIKVVNRRQRGLKFCYEKGLRGNPELQGKVTFSWRIGLDGRVMKVLVEDDSLQDREVTQCMQRAVKRWRFPQPDGGLCQVRFPFVFNAGL
ncbi:MAG: AgmX/PglI C-terminal domain-containing protein [Bradymonadia bacterium]